MRQRADLRRHAAVGENAGNAGLVRLGPDQTFVKSVSLTELESNALDGFAILSRRGLFAERMQNAAFMFRQAVRVPGGEAPQQRSVARLGLLDDAFSLPRRIGRVEAQHLVNQAQVPVVVQQALFGRHFRINANPKTNVRLEFRRIAEILRGLGMHRRAPAKRRQRERQRGEPADAFRFNFKQINNLNISKNGSGRNS
jgi:hypothetical protein